MTVHRVLALAIASWLALGRLLGPGGARAAPASGPRAWDVLVSRLLLVDPPPSSQHRLLIRIAAVDEAILRRLIQIMESNLQQANMDARDYGEAGFRIALHQHALGLKFHFRAMQLHERLATAERDPYVMYDKDALGRDLVRAEAAARLWLSRAYARYGWSIGIRDTFWHRCPNYSAAGYFQAELATRLALTERRQAPASRARALAVLARRHIAKWQLQHSRHALGAWVRLHQTRIELAFGLAPRAIAWIRQMQASPVADLGWYTSLLEATARLRMGDTRRALGLLLALAQKAKSRPELTRALALVLPPLLSAEHPGEPWKELLARSESVWPCFASASRPGTSLAQLAHCARHKEAEALVGRGRLSEAAERFERAAEGPAGSAGWLEAATRAVVLREALGQREQASILRGRLVLEMEKAPARAIRGQGKAAASVVAGVPSVARLARAAWELAQATLADAGPARAEEEIRWYLRVFAKAGEPAHRLEALVRLAWLRWEAGCPGAQGLGQCLAADALRHGPAGRKNRPDGRQAVVSSLLSSRRPAVLREVDLLLWEARRIRAAPAKAGQGNAGHGHQVTSSWAAWARLLEAERALAATIDVTIPGALSLRLRRARPSRSDWQALEKRIQRKVRQIASLERRYLDLAPSLSCDGAVTGLSGSDMPLAVVARIAQIRHHLWVWLAFGLPRPALPSELGEAYAEAVGEPFAGLKLRAFEAYQACLRIARTRRQGDRWQRLCEAGSQALDPERHRPVRDRGPAPGRAPSTLRRADFRR